MKNRNIRILQILALLFLLFNSTIGICFALEVGDENAQLEFYGDDAGVYFIVIDPQGRRAGFDPTTLKYVEEFPASFGVSLTVRDEISEKFNSGGMMNLIPGTYTIEVLGVALTTYDMNIIISRRIPGEGSTGFDFKTLKLTPEQIAAIKASFTDFDFEGVIDKGQTQKFQFTYNSDPSKPAGTATKIVTLSSLKQDIILSRKIGWIDNDGIMNSLLKKVEAIEASIARGNIKTARNQLNAFINEVNAQKGKHILSYTEEPAYIKKGSELVRLPKEGQAVKILLEDAQYLMESLLR